MLASERINPRIPAALIGLLLAASTTAVLRLEAHGVTTLGALAGAAPRLSIPAISFDEFRLVAPLAVIVALVVMVQTAATTRAFSKERTDPTSTATSSALAPQMRSPGLTGAFPIDASPPRTAIVAETGGASQLAGLICAALALGVLLFGGEALARVPHAALAGILLFVALRIVRVGAIVDVWRRSRPEFLLILATVVAMIALPIEQGVSVGIIMSLLHGAWTTTRAQAIEYERIPGTSVWWPKGPDFEGQVAPGVKVIALQAPLSFLNAYNFRNAIVGFASGEDRIRLIVIEANALVEIDYTGATVLGDLVRRLRARGVDIAIARLEFCARRRASLGAGLVDADRPRPYLSQRSGSR